MSELEAYLERSKSAPFSVALSSPQLVTAIAPHTSRLVALTTCVKTSSKFNHIVEHLRDPNPVLRSLDIRTENRHLKTLKLPPGLRDGLFRNLKALTLGGISSFRGPEVFPSVTELSFYTGRSPYMEIHTILNILERLPSLVKFSAVFQTRCTETHSSHIVTLPCLQEIHIRTSADYRHEWPIIPPILPSLELPEATSVTLDSRLFPSTIIPILPGTSFGKQLPNYVNLPELRIDTTSSSGKITFRGLSQVAFTYHTESLYDYKRERRLWGGLPLSSVRRVTAVLVDPTHGIEETWVTNLLGDMASLDLLELGGDCGRVLKYLRRRLSQGTIRIDVQKLIVRGGEYAKWQALKLERARGDLGLQNMSVACLLDPEVNEGLASARFKSLASSKPKNPTSEFENLTDPGLTSSSDDEVSDEFTSSEVSDEFIGSEDEDGVSFFDEDSSSYEDSDLEDEEE